MKDEIRRMAVIGSGVFELTRNRAEQMVKGLVSSGDLTPAGAQALVSDLVERSKRTTQELTRFIRNEIKNQIESLGLASTRELERIDRRVGRLEDNFKKMRGDVSSVGSLEKRLDQLEAGGGSGPSTGTPVGNEPGTKPKSTTKKVTAKKTVSKRSDK